MLGATDVETCAVRICELTRALFDTTRSAFFVLEDRDLVPIAAAGPYGDRAAGRALHVPPGVEPIFDEAVRTRQVIVVNDFHTSPYAATPIPLPFRPKAALVIPLVDASGLLGILTASELDQPQRFGPTRPSRHSSWARSPRWQSGACSWSTTCAARAAPRTSS